MNRISWHTDERLTSLVDDEGNVSLLSVDIFDTLLFRRLATSDEVYVEVGREAVRRGLLRPGISPYAFKALRKHAEAVARRGVAQADDGREEVGIVEIYHALPEECGDREAMAELELEVDHRAVYLNPVVESLIRAFSENGVPVVLISDTYYSRTQLISLLERTGFATTLVDAVYSSCTEGVRKGTGHLFQRVLERHAGGRPDGVWHVGDNITADYYAAQEVGVRAIHYGADDSLRMLFQLEEIRHGGVAGELASMRLLAAQLCSGRSVQARQAFRVGAAVLGPALSYFASWVVEACRGEGIQRLWGLMREGGLMAELVENAARHRGVQLTVSRFYVSRHASFYGFIGGVDGEAVDYASERLGHTVGDFLSVFGIDVDATRWRVHRDTPLADLVDEGGRGVSLWEALRQELVAGELNAVANRYVSRQRRLLEGYLAQEGAENGRIATVDLGWGGSIQRALDRMTRKSGSRFSHFILFGDRRSAELMIEGGDIRGCLGSSGEGPTAGFIQTLFRCAGVLEHLLCGDSGTTVGYRESGGRIEPVTRKVVESPADDDIRRQCEEGIRTFQALWLERGAAVQAGMEEAFRFGLCKIVHRMVDLPSREEAAMIGGMTAELNNGTDATVALCPDDGMRLIHDVGEEAFLDIHQNELGYEGIPWPQGCVTVTSPGFLLARHVGLGGGGGYLAAMLRFARRLVGLGVTDVVAYGAGEVGRAFISAASMSGLSIRGVVDGNRHLHGTAVGDVMVVSLEHALRIGWTRYAVTSYAFASHIERHLMREAEALGVSVEVFKPTGG